MFRDLYAVARHTPLHLIIAPNGEQLKIIVTPKPSGDAANNNALAKPFSAIGTPEELDREFPAALARYAGAVNDLRTSLELPLDELEAAKKKASAKDEKKAAKQRAKEEEAKRRSDGAKKAAETRAAKAEEARKAKEAKAQARADAAAAKKAKRQGIQLPGTTSVSASVPAVITTAPAEAQHRPGLPGKDECLADYRNLKRVHGDKLTRRLFIRKAPTMRRYEKLWPNWAKFVKEAEAQLELPIAPAERPEPVQPATKAETAWPFPIGERADTTFDEIKHEHGPAASTARQQGSEGELGTEAAASGANVIEGSDPSGSAPDNKSEAAPSAEAGVTEPPAPVPAAETRYTLIDSADDAVVRTSRYPYVPGEKIGVEIDGEVRCYVVDRVEGDTAFSHAALHERKLIVNAEGNPLSSTSEIYEIADQVGELTDGDWRVVLIRADAYVVKAAKPRLRGPAAAAAEITTTVETAAE